MQQKKSKTRKVKNAKYTENEKVKNEEKENRKRGSKICKTFSKNRN